jgi:peroxiredoxin Q/BCP
MRAVSFATATLLFATALPGCFAAGGPQVGEEAKDFELAGLDGTSVKLSTLADGKPVVLVVLRGYPGYQCPLCSKQFGEFLGKADEIKKAGAKVVFVYPGPASDLTTHAKAFLSGLTIPAHFTILTDPDYTFTNAYGLRWNARNETAYPSTFVLDGKRKVTFAKVSKSHGDRTKAADVLKAVPAK